MVQGGVVRILLADDHGLIRTGLLSLLRQYSYLQIVAEAADGRQAVELALSLKPDVILMDICMPRLNGIEATREILRHYPDARVIGLSMHPDRQFVVEMLRAGACGYLLKDSTLEELVEAITNGNSARPYLTPRVAVMAAAEGLAESPPAAAPSALSPRERQVLQMMADGKTTKQIAAELTVSVKTIETHRTRIMNRLGIYSVAELTKYAIRQGLTSL